MKQTQDTAAAPALAPVQLIKEISTAPSAAPKKVKAKPGKPATKITAAALPAKGAKGGRR